MKKKVKEIFGEYHLDYISDVRTSCENCGIQVNLSFNYLAFNSRGFIVCENCAKRLIKEIEEKYND